MVQEIRTHGGNPYPHKFSRTHRCDHFRKEYEPKCKEKNVFLDETVALTGRINVIRASGQKLIFIDLVGDNAKVQIMAQADSYCGSAFEDLHKILRRGDIIGVEGNPGLSKSEELSVKALKIVALSYCMHMLPKLEKGKETTPETNPLNKDTRYR